VIASPLPQTPAIFEVVAPLSVPIKMFRGGFMSPGKVEGNHPEGKNFYQKATEARELFHFAGRLHDRIRIVPCSVGRFLRPRSAIGARAFHGLCSGRKTF
jgi:hypothetical protein